VKEGDEKAHGNVEYLQPQKLKCFGSLQKKIALEKLLCVSYHSTYHAKENRIYHP
jgi:hypothetical protein